MRISDWSSDVCSSDLIVDQLYSRLRYSGTAYTHLRAAGLPDNQVVTIMGPSKTESLSGYRLGVAFGAAPVVERMEKLQAIVSLRAAGYNQAVLGTWFSERSEERRVGKECVSTCRSGWSPNH